VTDARPGGDRPLHVLSVWNPSYADDAMDRHLEVLLGWAERRDREEAEEDDVYVWWGKLRSPLREEKLPHRDEVLDLEEPNWKGVDTHRHLAATGGVPTVSSGRRNTGCMFGNRNHRQEVMIVQILTGRS